MIVTKQNLRLLVGVLVIYCCIESTVGGTIRVLNANEPNTTTSSQNGTTGTDSSAETTVTKKVHTYPTMPHKKTTTTENPSTSSVEGAIGGLYRLGLKLLPNIDNN